MLADLFVDSDLKKRTSLPTPMMKLVYATLPSLFAALCPI